MAGILTIKSVIRWEQLREKPFLLMDYSDKEDVEALLYTTTVCGNGGKAYTFDVFRQSLANEKVARELLQALERDISIVVQFQKKLSEAAMEGGKREPGRICDTVSSLVMAGLDAHYALNEMELCDLPLYVEAYNRKRREEMEENRIWTYYSMLPHIDASKLRNGARDIIVFPWDEDSALEEAQRALREDVEKFEKFMEKGKDFIKV